MNRIFLCACALLSLIVTPLVVTAEQENIIGVIASQTGPTAHVGQSIWRGVELAMKLHPNQARFVLEDDGYSPPRTISAFQKLSQDPRVKGIIVFGSPTSLAISDRAEKKRLPTISIAMTEKTTVGRSFVFRQFLSSAKQSEILLSRLSGFKSVAVATLQNDGPMGLRDNLVPQLPMKVLLDTEVNPGEVDFRTICAKIKQLQPEAVLSLLIPPQNGLFARQLRDVGFSGKIFGGPPMSDRFEIAAASGALNDAHYVSSGSPVWEAFRKEHFSNEDVIGELGLGFDAALIFIQALDQHPDGAPEKIAHHLQTLKDFHGAVGTYGALPNNSFDVPGTVYHIREDGVFAVDGATSHQKNISK